MNLDYEPRPNTTVSISTMYDRSTTDLHGAPFGTIARSKPGTDYLVRDSLGRPLLIGATGTLNGNGGLLYNPENEINYRVSNRFLGGATVGYFPTDWVTFDGNFGYDTRTRADRDWVVKGYRTSGIDLNTNLGNGSISDFSQEALNGALGATLRKQISTDLLAKVTVRGSFEQDKQLAQRGGGQQFVVKDVFTLSNLSTGITATSREQTIKRAGGFAGATAEYKDRYIEIGRAHV